MPPTDGHDTAGEFDPRIHGYHGYVNITLPNAKFPSDSHIIASTQQLPEEFPFNLDSNSGNPIGLGKPVVLLPTDIFQHFGCLCEP